MSQKDWFIKERGWLCDSLVQVGVVPLQGHGMPGERLGVLVEAEVLEQLQHRHPPKIPSWKRPRQETWVVFKTQPRNVRAFAFHI